MSTEPMHGEELLAAVKQLAANWQLSDVMQATTETELVYRWGCNDIGRYTGHPGRVHVVATGNPLPVEKGVEVDRPRALKLRRLIFIHYHTSGNQGKVEFTADGEYTVECSPRSPSLWEFIAGLQLECA